MIKSSCHIYFLCLLDNKITHNAIRIGYFEFMNFFLLYYDTFNKILGFTNKCILTFHRILYFRNNNLGSKCNECTSINLRWYMSKFFDRPLIYFLAPPLIWMEFTSMLGTTTLQPVQFPCTSCWARSSFCFYALRPNRASCERHSVCWHVMAAFCIINTMFQFSTRANNYSRGIDEWVAEDVEGEEAVSLGLRYSYASSFRQGVVVVVVGVMQPLHGHVRCHHRSWPSATWCMLSRPCCKSGGRCHGGEEPFLT
jgi:hypothetical protein